MKKNLSTLFTLLCSFFIITTLHAQNINVVPNPTASGSFTWTGDGALSGYAGNPIVLNDSLVLEYNATNTSDTSQLQNQLAVYKNGDSLHLIANPDAGHGVYFQSVQIVFNNKLFFIYLDALNIQRLASFDGTSITLYPNPDGGLGFIGSPRIFNNTLYVAYSNATGVTQFGTFNGSGITLIPNPDNSTIGFYNNYSVVFNNKICSRYVTAAGPKQLATYDGTSWTILPNPDNTTRGVQPIFPIEYKNKLYFTYYSATDQYQYLVYDGTTNPTLIANPQNSSINNQGVTGQFAIVLNDTLFLQYLDIANVYRLAKFDGTTISIVPNPDATTLGYYYTPAIYNNNLYILYAAADGSRHLAQYQSSSNSLLLIPNPDAGLGYYDLPVVFGNKLFIRYSDAQSLLRLAYYNGTSVQLISNPSGAYTGAAGNNGYAGSPIIWNNLLYMQFGSVPYSNAGNLAFFNGSILPVSLISFTAQKSGNASLLKWKTANEANNAYFSIEHSLDGTSFQPIGKVVGHGTISTLENYQFTDNTPAKGLNFYRLKQVDIDGNYTYSNIVTLSFDDIAEAFKIFPNPAVNNIKITMPLSSAASVISVYDLNGKKVMEKQINGNTVSQSIDVSTLSSGVYHVTLTQGTKQQTIKLVKE